MKPEESTPDTKNPLLKSAQSIPAQEKDRRIAFLYALLGLFSVLVLVLVGYIFFDKEMISWGDTKDQSETTANDEDSGTESTDEEVENSDADDNGTAEDETEDASDGTSIGNVEVQCDLIGNPIIIKAEYPEGVIFTEEKEVGDGETVNCLLTFTYKGAKLVVDSGYGTKFKIGLEEGYVVLDSSRNLIRTQYESLDSESWYCADFNSDCTVTNYGEFIGENTCAEDPNPFCTTDEPFEYLPGSISDSEFIMLYVVFPDDRDSGQLDEDILVFDEIVKSLVVE